MNRVGIHVVREREAALEAAIEALRAVELLIFILFLLRVRLTPRSKL